MTIAKQIKYLENKIRKQERIIGGREHVGASVEHDLLAIVAGEANRYKCSKSWVVSWCVDKAFKLKKVKPYWE